MLRDIQRLGLTRQVCDISVASGCAAASVDGTFIERLVHRTTANAIRLRSAARFDPQRKIRSG